MINKLKNILLHNSYTIYKNHFKKTQFGRLVAKKITDLGLISRTDLQIVQISSPILIQQSSSDSSLELLDQFQYSHEIESIQLPNFHLSPPLNFEISDKLNTTSYINVLLPSLHVKHMSGGPNTALLFAALLAEKGENIRLISCDVSAEGEEKMLYAHMDSLLRRPVVRKKIKLVDAFDRSVPVFIGINDVFFATAWWTAQIAKYGTKHTLYKSFIYLIQDFEPILHEASTFYSRALETYGLPHIPLVNTSLLLDHLVEVKAGLYADKQFVNNALAFEPAIDRNYYFPDKTLTSNIKKKVLLFYARPTMAKRNLFETGVVALRKAVASGLITNEHWEVWAMGEKLPPVPLGNGVELKPLPWLSFEEYAKQVRTADLLLSLMLSPHPSYPPLEMAASGKLVVTNSFSVKTSERLRKFSTNIIVAEPNPQSVAIALEKAISRINIGLPSYDPNGSIMLPETWEESLNDILPDLLSQIETLRSTPPGLNQLSLCQGYPCVPKNNYEVYRKNRLKQRRCSSIYKQELGLISFITSAYNTPSSFLLELGNSLFVQDGGLNFEWLILDNGSTKEETLDALHALTRYPNVRLDRVENNLGIIGGMRYLLEHAQGQYILPLDSDDLVEPDCVNFITKYIQINDYPALLYTDEDKVENNIFKDPYFKPDWDPVLFLHSCYVAHLCVIDREKALTLDLYSDKSAEGCHDWDSFIRFMNAGYTPCHIPEILYSWRIHSGSTSGHIKSKDYISASHRSTLQKALAFTKAKHIVDLKLSPLFHHDVDWWFRHKRNASISCETLILSGSLNDSQDLCQKINELDSDFINIRWEHITPDNDEWLWESAALFEMFPDAVMVGGTVHNGQIVIGGHAIFGFSKGFDCPDVGRSINDPGYFAWLFKTRSVSAVSTAHCVVRRDFLLSALSDSDFQKISINLLGPWLGALADKNHRRIIFTPFLRAKGAWVPEDKVPDIDRSLFLSKFWCIMAEPKFYSPRLGLTPACAYTVVSSADRFSHLKKLQLLTLPYSNWLEWQINHRLQKYSLTKSLPSLSLITTIYERTNFSFLEELSDSIANQTVEVFEWIVVAHGLLDLTVLNLWQSKFDSRISIKLVIEADSLSIMEAMNLALRNTTGDYIVPIDADDLITHDALQIISYYIYKNPGASLLYSDEDMLINGKPCNPYLRADFDPVLNLESSYIWHLCVINRRDALENSLYSDLGATWCHDWNTLFKLLESPINRIVHIPEVLYHWRQHKSSTSNNNTISTHQTPSLKSVRYVLEQQVSKLSDPELYMVSQWPINRGSYELYIARKDHNLPNFIVANDDLEAQLDLDDPSSIVVFTQKNIFIDALTVYPEVARLFELHSHIGAVGGLTVDPRNIIVDSCYVTNASGALESPWLDHDPAYSDLYSIAMKPQTVASTGNTLGFFRTSALRQSNSFPLLIDQTSSSNLVRICEKLKDNSWSICFSPLVRAKISTCITSKYLYQQKSLKHNPVQTFGRYGILKNFVD